MYKQRPEINFTKYTNSIGEEYSNKIKGGEYFEYFNRSSFEIIVNNQFRAYFEENSSNPLLKFNEKSLILFKTQFFTKVLIEQCEFANIYVIKNNESDNEWSFNLQFKTSNSKIIRRLKLTQMIDGLGNENANEDGYHYIFLEGRISFSNIPLITSLSIFNNFNIKIGLNSVKNSSSLSFNLVNLPFHIRPEIKERQKKYGLKYFEGYLIENKIYNKYFYNNEIFTSMEELEDKMSKSIELLNKIDFKKEVIDYFDYYFIGKVFYHTGVFDTIIARQQRNKDFIKYLDQLFLNTSVCFRKKPEHEFVISKTKELSDEDFGKLGEKALNKYFHLAYPKNEYNLKLKINWLNENYESFSPYDFEVEIDDTNSSTDYHLGSHNFYVEAKTTRGVDENIFYLSIKEIKKLLEKPDKYIIARISFMEYDEEYKGILLNSEFIVNFYRIKEETIKLISLNINEWIDHYNENKIRFRTNQFQPLFFLNKNETFPIKENFKSQYFSECMKEICKDHPLHEEFTILNNYDPEKKLGYLWSSLEAIKLKLSDPANYKETFDALFNKHWSEFIINFNKIR